MLINKKNHLLLQKATRKFYNNPGFFEGIVDAIQKFHLVDFIQFHIYLDDIILFLKRYHVDGFGINGQGELVQVVHPFNSDADIHLALYLIIDYLK